MNIIYYFNFELYIRNNQLIIFNYDIFSNSERL
jgi:hypothetical protein